MKKEALSDWFGDPSSELVHFMHDWREQAVQQSTRSTLPTDISIRRLLDDQKRRIDMAEMFYLTTDIGRLIKDAAETMPPHRMIAEDFPSMHGMLWFEEPMSFKLGDDTVSIMTRGVSWSRENVGNESQDRGPGMVTWDWVDARVAQTWMRPNTLTKATPLFPAAYGAVRDGRVPWTCWDVNADSIDPTTSVAVAGSHPSVNEAFTRYYEQAEHSDDFVPIPPGSEVLKSGIEDGHWRVRIPEGAVVHFEPDPITRFLQAFFLFMRQELPSMHVLKDTLPKPMARRFRDKHINDSPISVIYWRRRESSPHNVGTGRTLSYRHPRRGHWRNENYRMVDGVRVRFPIWIAPTIVGDESLPYRERDVVNVVNR